MKTAHNLEEAVSSLLSLQGWAVLAEHIVGHKKVDLLADKVVCFGTRQRYAVECKDYARHLTEEEATHIFADYLPLIQNGFIDNLLLVTYSGLSPAAVTYCEQARGLVHLTLRELENQILDFSHYLTAVKDEWETNPIRSYYIRQDYRTPTADSAPFPDIENALLAWVADDSSRPVAILAGYGMGKTTLATHMTGLLLERHATDNTQRIPILIPLQHIGSEQSLEGLVGRHFTALYPTEHYSFSLFMALNARGRFVIFLDGFDEMKRTMSWETMRYNFEQLNRLVVSNAKVVLGGRPTAFLTEDEHSEALHGRRIVNGRLRPIHGWPDFQEYHLQPFTLPQVRSFVTAYARLVNQTSKNTETTGRAAKRVRSKAVVHRIEEDPDENLLNIASRPVQLKMLIDVFPDLQEEGRLDGLTRTLLYSEFVDGAIRRELSKRERQTFSAKDRRAFAASLAWLMWTENLGTEISAGRIPDQLFRPFLVRAGNATLDEVRRDLITGCFLEVKRPEGLYFAHRSFQEFLVAEKIVEIMGAGGVPPADLTMNDVVSEFIIGQVGVEALKTFQRSLFHTRGTLPEWLIDLLVACAPSPSAFIVGEMVISPWAAVALARGIERDAWKLSDDQQRDIITRYLQMPPRGQSEQKSWARLVVVLTLQLRRIYHRLGLDVCETLRSLLPIAETYAEFGRRKSVAVGVLGRAHLVPEFCDCSSWHSSSPEVETEILELKEKGRVYQPSHGGHAGQKRTPHKLLGVTRKKQF